MGSTTYLQWEKCFEQHDPPTEIKQSKLMWVNKHTRSSSLTEKQDLISLIKEYIDVFAYEDMPGLDPQVAMHCLNIKADAKPVKQ